IYMMITKTGVYWFADTTVSIEPSAEELADLAIRTAQVAKDFSEIEPRVAMLSFSNFGSNRHPSAEKMARATQLVRERMPSLVVDGEMQADTALAPEISRESFP